MQFSGVDIAWFADHATFTGKPIEPFMVKGNVPDDEQLLAYAENQLIKAANIMMQGIQPTVIANKSGRPHYRYELRCHWHVIAKSFAELITNEKLKLEFVECKICGKDISGLKKGAGKCQECAEKKRKIKN